MSLLALQFNPHKCPCCWDVQGTNLSDWDTLVYSDATGPCHALCMPFSSDAPDWLAYDDVTCRLQEVLSGVSPSFTPRKSTTWLESDSGVYWSKILTNGTCQAQYAQYCTVDEAGNRGRAWVVELWIKDGVGSITNFNTKVLDWECKCSGWDGGAGARFEWTFDIEVPAACTPVSTCADGCPECYTINPSGFGGGTDGANANGTFVLTRNPCTSPNCGGSTAWSFDDGMYNWTLVAALTVPSGSVRTWTLKWGPSAGATCNGPLDVWYSAQTAAVIDCNAPPALPGGRTPAGTSKMTTWPSSIALTPGGC